MRKTLEQLVRGESLSESHATDVARRIVDGEVDDAQIGALLSLLRAKGETIDEICGFAGALLDAASVLEVDTSGLVDTCGTGGDSQGTFNVSTAAAIVVAGAGVRVAKHGNRSVSSRSGSADVLTALGIAHDMPPEQIVRCIRDVGVGFMFAPRFHPGARHAASARRSLGIRTIFNLVGPIVNPARVRRQVMGVYDPRILEDIASVFRRRGAEHVMVVHSEDGLDEFSISAPTQIAELLDGEIRTHSTTPESMGVARHSLDALRAESVDASADMIRSVLANEAGAALEMVVANSGAAIFVSGAVTSIRDGVDRARESIASGAAGECLSRLRAISAECA